MPDKERQDTIATAINYKDAGVDVQAGENAVKAIKNLVRQTYTPDVLSDLGSFGGLFRFHQPSMTEPVLVASTDGVGTKLRVAVMAQRYDTVGQDLVNHCVNDILVQGAVPLFFLDYIGLSKLVPEHVQNVISGMVKACSENGCALIGGEMAEMPGIYHGDDFDLVGTIVGVTDRQHLLPGDRIKDGDILVGFPSSGLHTNGYSLARKVVFEHLGLDVNSYVPELQSTVADLLLSVHRSYLPLFREHLQNPSLHGLAHITGGGIPGNLKRIIPDGLTAHVVYPDSSFPPLFQWLRDSAGLSRATMLESFNLGIGMIAVFDPRNSEMLSSLTEAQILGEIKKAKIGEPKVVV